MTKAILAVLPFVFIQTVFAQQKTYLAAEAAVTNDIYEIVDKGGALKRVPLISGLWGFSLRQDLDKNLFIETGLLRKYYNEGIGFKIASDYSETNAINAWLIPLRLGSKLNLYKEKIHLVSLLGVTYSINSDYGYGNGGGSSSEKYASGDSLRYVYTSYYDYRKSFLLIQAGLGLEFKLFQTGLLSFSTNYYAGVKKIIQQDIIYKVNNSPEQAATAQSKGDMFGLGISLKYPVSNFWAKVKTKD